MTVRTEQTIPIIPDHEMLRMIGRGAYGEIWLARTLTGTLSGGEDGASRTLR